LSGPRNEPSAQKRTNEASISVGVSPWPAWKLTRSKAFNQRRLA
jgi:hypothetical protein